MPNFLKQLGVVKLGAILGVTAAVLIGLMFIVFRLATPPMSLLYSGLDFEEAGRIMARLDQAGIPYEIKGNGGIIMAPKDRVLNIRMELATEGLPTGGSVGYEIFDNMDALGTTSFVQNLNHLRALEGELSRTIKSLSGIDSARVHLVIPERALFSDTEQQTRASIVVTARRGSMSAENVQAIRNLVASAVPNLSPGNVSIVDSQGRLLASPLEEDGAAGLAGTFQDRNASYEDRIRQRVEDLVASVVGQDKVRVQVSAEIDYNRIVEQSETYDPDGQVIRSTQTVEEQASDTEKETDAVSVSNNIPDGQQSAPEGIDIESSNSRLEETVNFEISRTTKTETQEAGRITKLSVAVVVDGSYETAADGTITYLPRSADEMERINALVQSAIGYDENRGDSIEVSNLQFAQLVIPEADTGGEPLLGLGKDDYIRIGEIVASIIVGVILMLVLRTAFTRADASGGASVPALAGAVPGEGSMAVAAGPDGQPIALNAPATAALPAPAGHSGAASQIDIAQIEGKVKDSSIKKVGELVSAHPEESVAILRSWLHQS